MTVYCRVWSSEILYWTILSSDEATLRISKWALQRHEVPSMIFSRVDGGFLPALHDVIKLWCFIRGTLRPKVDTSTVQHSDGVCWPQHNSCGFTHDRLISTWLLVPKTRGYVIFIAALEVFFRLFPSFPREMDRTSFINIRTHGEVLKRPRSRETNCYVRCILLGTWGISVAFS